MVVRLTHLRGKICRLFAPFLSLSPAAAQRGVTIMCHIKKRSRTADAQRPGQRERRDEGGEQVCDGGHVHRGRGLERDQQQARRIERAREERREKGLALPGIPECELPGAHACREVRVVGKELERQVAAGEVDDVMDAPVHAEEPVEEQRQRGAGEAEDVAPGQLKLQPLLSRGSLTASQYL